MLRGPAPPMQPREHREPKSFELTVEAIGLLITALLVLLIAFCAQQLLRLLSWGQLQPDLTLLAYAFAFYILSLFLTVGTRQRPDHAPFLLANLAFHGGFLVAGVLLLQPRLPGVWLLSGSSCGALLTVARYGLAVLRRRASDGLFVPGVTGSPPLVERCFFVRTPVHHALPIGAALGTLYGAILGDAPTPLPLHTAAGVFAAVALLELRALFAAARLLSQNALLLHAQPPVELLVDTSFDRCALTVRGPRGDLLARTLTGVRRAQLLGQLQRLMVFSWCALVLWQLELRALSAGVVAALILGVVLLAVVVPYVVGQRATQREAAAPTSSLPGLASWLLLACALVLGVVAFACLAPLLASARL